MLHDPDGIGLWKLDSKVILSVWMYIMLVIKEYTNTNG